MYEIFRDKNGGLNRNWKILHKKNPDIINSIDMPYNDKTKISLVLLGLTELTKCYCGKELAVEKIKGGAVYCSTKCASNDPKVTKLRVSNTDIAKKNEKISGSNKGHDNKAQWAARKAKYGESGMTEEALEKSREQMKSNAEKAKQTCLEKYGVENSFSIPEVIEKIRDKQIENNSSRNHLPDWLYDKEQFISQFISIDQTAESSGACKDLIYRLSYEYGLREKYTSIGETQLIEFIELLGFTPSKTRKVIAPLELDVYIEEKNLALEFNGIYWHSSGSKETDSIKSKHLDKTELCEQKGIQLLHIFENEWVDPVKQEIWKSVIRTKLGKSERIYARKCIIKDVPYKEAKDFINRTHLQGHTTHSRAKGLYYNGNLVQIVTFASGRYRDGQELIRMCSELNTVIVGGASKLLKDEKFFSYANRRWSTGNVYSSIGMTQIGISPPSDYYIENGRLFHRSVFMKFKLRARLKKYDPNLTAIENCYNNNIRRIWDCGNIVFETV
ncbi:homing endonuclease [Pseudomonas phage PspYZU05]|uniref:Hef-like homing endonuclease n=1 Tax=Pseudomonas phage PspYZU05 TaxID=1983556 RepID=A0A2U7NBV0_9CAUD|nr:homing endonuclease [Pseudomonas phage PspYZU05]ASD52089.1 hypothetical protein PspYZU05_137 [Pseudomonas phage PspYZU05]